MSSLIWNTGHELLLPDIVRAENCYLYDKSGKRYVDLESGVWCTSVGHGNRRVLRAFEEQFVQIGHTGFCYTHESSESAALEMLSLTRLDGGRCVFLCSGSEAVEFGVRLARSILDKPLMLTMHDSYFGAYGSAHQRAEDEWYSFDWTPCAECPETEKCDQTCSRFNEVPLDQIGGFLFEPGSSSGFVRFPPEKLIRTIVDCVRVNDGLVLVNEVTTGIGRTGKWFGYRHYDLTPDIVAMGKGIGNGYPVAVTVMAPRVMERLGDTPVRYVQSHQNDPLGAVIAREVIRQIREDRLVERARELGEMLCCGLEQIRVRTGLIREVRGRGLMAAVDLDDNADAAFTLQTHRELVRRGFIVGKRPGLNVLRLDPALTIEKNDIEDFLIAFEDVLTP